MSDPTDEDVRKQLRATLKGVDLESTTERKLRKQLEEHFGCSLKEHKAVFKEEIEAFLATSAAVPDAADSPAASAEAGEAEAEEAAPAAKPKRKARAAKAISLSAEMQAFLGVDDDAALSRGEVVKRIWAYIHEHSLQDPANKRRFLKDDKLATIFTFPVDMLTMQRQLSRHCKTTADMVEPPAKKAKAGKAGKAAPKAAKAAKAAKTGDGEPAKKTGFNKEMKLSPQLAELLGVEAASRGDCSKRMWAYFKEHKLQHPDNGQVIMVKKDPKLHAIFGVDECKGFGMAKFLAPHFLGPSDAA